MGRTEPPGLEAWRANEYREMSHECVKLGRPDMAIQFIALAEQIDRQRANFFFDFMTAASRSA